jgi:hypothetical protein
MTLTQLADLAQLALGDPLAATWLQTTIEQWCTEAIRDYSSHFPAIEDTGAVDVVAGTQTYNLPASCTGIVRIEYPVGETPPHYLKPMTRRSWRFHASDDYYDWQPSNKAGVVPTLTLSATPTAGQHYQVTYTAPHITQGGTLIAGSDIPVPDNHTPLLVLYVQWKAAQERLSVVLQETPAPLTSYIGDVAQNARNLRAQYDAAIKTAKAEILASPNASWTDPWRQDLYEPIY